jgi:hypothetical protein
MTHFALTSLALLLTLPGCGGKGKTARVQRPPLSLTTISQVKVGQVTPVQAGSVFGHPDMKTPVAEKQTAWIYFEGKTPTARMSIVVDDDAAMVMAINWFVRPNDAECNLDVAKSRYPGARFVLQMPDFTNPEMTMDLVRFADNRNGYEIIFQQSSKLVRSLRWETPATSPLRRPGARKARL